jgi:SnoaL-like domain
MQCRHLTMNHLYVINGAEATGQSTTVVTLATAGGYKIFGQGAYRDRLIKEGGEWRFVHRSVRTDCLVDDPEKPVNLADPEVAILLRPLVEAARRLGGDSDE